MSLNRNHGSPKSWGKRSRTGFHAAPRLWLGWTGGVAAEATAPEQDRITTDPSFVRNQEPHAYGCGALSVGEATGASPSSPPARRIAVSRWRCFLQTHLAIVFGSLLAASLSLAADFTGLSSSPSSTVTPSKSCTTNTLNAHPPPAVPTTPPKNGEAHILACYFASYGKNKIRAASPTKMATKRPGIMTTSMVPSWA